MTQPGKHEATPISFQFGRSANKKTEMVTVNFKLLDGSRLHWNGYFTDDTADRTLESLQHCGWDGEKFDQNLKGFGSQNVELVVEMEPNQDGTKMYPRVQWVNRLITFAPGELFEKKEMLDFASRMSKINEARKAKLDEEESEEETE